MLEEVLTAVGFSKGSIIGGFLGAVVSLRFIDGTWWQRIGTAGAGWVCATVLAPTLIELVELNLSTKNEMAVAFVVALFGMSIAAQILKAIPEWVSSAREKFLGPKGGSQ